MGAENIVGRVSIVVPIYNEADSLWPLYEALSSVMGELGRPAEVILVNDGSTDGSAEILNELADKDERFTVVHLRRNFGQTAAMSAGFDIARGEAIVAIDADLQNDPADIPALLERLEDGYDVVSGWRRNRQEGLFEKRIPSMIASRLISRVTGVHIHDYGCTLKAYRADVMKNVKLYGDMHLFIPALCALEGGRVTEMEVSHKPRKFGRTKYGLSRTMQMLLNLATVRFLLKNSDGPMQLFGRWGLGLSGLGLLLMFGLGISRVAIGTAFLSNPALVLAFMLMFMGLQTVLLGYVAELQARTYFEAQDKPVYSIRYVKYRAGRKRADFPGD